ncbi:hypothetical protein BUALT_Bualt17G0094200 [Buddleja alternifolia]|uniref:Uncharacterized protein n=1 Tax=Buddleja alternifolia TaxID=168488 RepID=A0AAV6WCS1_9LAMI|nr:hypothetical protein BUALT_Bualt17G0094200 [Buddleja alternifolia]
MGSSEMASSGIGVDTGQFMLQKGTLTVVGGDSGGGAPGNGSYPTTDAAVVGDLPPPPPPVSGTTAIVDQTSSSLLTTTSSSTLSPPNLSIFTALNSAAAGTPPETVTSLPETTINGVLHLLHQLLSSPYNLSPKDVASLLTTNTQNLSSLFLKRPPPLSNRQPPPPSLTTS